jgi:GNAT superfamily N-acetyltransferase
MRIEPFRAGDVRPAASLVAERVRTLREHVPVLPRTWQDPAAWDARIAAFTADGQALAAHDEDRLVGFLAAERDEDFSRAYLPEWASGTVPGGRRILESLYATASRRWVADGLRTHVFGALRGQAGESEALSWLGFGAFVVDAIRGLDPLPVAGAEVRIRPATADDLDAVIALEDGLRRHLMASPVFLVLPPSRTVEEHRARLLDPDVVTLLAEDRGVPVAHLRIGSCAEDVATIVRDPGTASISGAFTVADRREAGVATALLAAGLDRARELGYVRCAVDFETANLEAARFWTRWFEPVAIWHVRRLHPRAVADPG